MDCDPAKVGADSRITYGLKHLGPRDGAEKDEGEITGDARPLKTAP